MANQITYTDKVDLNETSVADINKVKASDLNEIKSVVNESSAELTNLQTFSTTEVDTGKVWIDGKPIYRIVFDVNIDTSTAGWKEVGSISFEEIISSSFVCNTSNEPTRYRPNNTYVNLSFYNGKCYTAGTGDWSSTSSLILKKVVVEYTKAD